MIHPSTINPNILHAPLPLLLPLPEQNRLPEYPSVLLRIRHDMEDQKSDSVHGCL